MTAPVSRLLASQLRPRGTPHAPCEPRKDDVKDVVIGRAARRVTIARPSVPSSATPAYTPPRIAGNLVDHQVVPLADTSGDGRRPARADPRAGRLLCHPPRRAAY